MRNRDAAIGLRGTRTRPDRGSPRACVSGERWERAVAQMRRELTSFELDLAVIRPKRALAPKYRPDQRRGACPGSGRFADGSGSGSGRTDLAGAPLPVLVHD